MIKKGGTICEHEYGRSVRAGRGERVKRTRDDKFGKLRELDTIWSARVARSTFEQKKTRRASQLYAQNF